MSVEAVNKRLDRGLVEVTKVARALAGLLAHHEQLRVDQSEGVNHNLALDGLNRVDDDGHGARVKLLERLLGVDIDGRKPAAETGMGVIPADDGLGTRSHWLAAVKRGSSRKHLPAGLAEHVHHLCLEYRIDSLDTNSSSGLGHGENVHDLDCEIVDKLAQHQTHNFHGHTGATVAQHLEKSQRRNVNSFRVIDEVCVILCDPKM